MIQCGRFLSIFSVILCLLIAKEKAYAERRVVEIQGVEEWSIYPLWNSQLNALDKLQGSEEIIMKDHEKLLTNDFSHGLVRPVRYFSRNCSGLALLSSHPGAGKTLLSLGLAQALARRQQRVLLVDLDWNKATLRTILRPSVSVRVEELVAEPGHILKQGIVTLGSYFDFLGIDFSSPSLPRGENSGSYFISHLIDCLARINKGYAYIIFDTASGMGETNLALLQHRLMGIFISSAEPESLLDTFALLKSVYPHLSRPQLRLILNQVLDYQNGESAQHTIRYALHHFMDQEIQLLGLVPFEEDLYLSGLSAFSFAKHSSVFDKIQQIAGTLQGDHQVSLQAQPAIYCF